MSAPSEKLILGAGLTQEFFGQELFEKIRSESRDDLPSRIGAEYIAEVCFSSYNRPGLEFRDRSMMNIVMLVALNRAPELRLHIRAALHNGLSEEQICEICRHAMIYCGVPAGRDALRIASDVFDEVKKDNQKTSRAKMA
ncbi:hypothetical protein NKR23_g5797 [Pleurostoma richardsiae]|uniref:Carboxymuconolactone decarboxylase-like domain-containing protein n=1 Tax=Pleurostoma richardsiae TaxID=41990 RepID=A0AA38S0L8_9PEZI|nr:hypothetical protein NKR23_g5797 [Pleurostoma richardsiae]